MSSVITMETWEVEIEVYEKYEGRHEGAYFKLQDIDYIKKGNVLLYS